MTEPVFRCADQAQERGDDLAGTATPGQSWILIEHPGPWPFAGFVEVPFPAEVIEAVRTAASRIRARIMLIRRHGRDRTSSRRAWAVLRYAADGNHRQTWGGWSEPEDLLEIGTAVDRPGTAGLPAVYLVCTHGVHDACCAIRGRPLVRELTEHWPQQTWECSHVGGDRFAANLVVLPDGIFYGDLGPDAAVGVVQRLRDGSVSADHLRGYTNLVPAAQAAVIEVLRRYGPARRNAITVDHMVRTATGWQVRIRCAAPLPADLTVSVGLAAGPLERLTCRAPAASRATVYRIEALRVLGPDG